MMSYGLETQRKGFLLFGRDRNTGFWIRLIERAGSKAIVTEVFILGKIDRYGEVFDFPIKLGHFSSLLTGSTTHEVFALLANEEISNLNIAVGDALIFDYGRKAKPNDICIAPLGDRPFLVRIVSKTYDTKFLSDVVASEYPIPEKLTNLQNKKLLNWYPLSYSFENTEYFEKVLEDQNLQARELPEDLILATAIRLTRQLTF